MYPTVFFEHEVDGTILVNLDVNLDVKRLHANVLFKKIQELKPRDTLDTNSVATSNQTNRSCTIRELKRVRVTAVLSSVTRFVQLSTD